jgi:hypothetical protein
MKIDELKANAAQKIAEYVGGDTDILPKLLFESGWGKKGLESICLFSDLFRIGIERLTTFNAINDVQKRLYFENVGIFEDFVYQKLKGATKQRQKAGQHFKNLKNKLIVAGNKKGLHKNVHQVYIPPSIDSLELLSIRKEVKEEMDKFPTIAENLLQKYFFGNMLNALMKEFNTDYGLYDKKKKALDENKSLTILIDQDFKRVYCSLKTTMKENSDWALKHLEKGTIKLDTFEKYLAMDKETTNFVLNKTVEIEDFFNAVKMAVSEKEPTEIMELNRAYSKFIGKHACSPETFWNRIENHYKKINEFLVDKGLEVVYKTGDYLYVTGNVASLKKDNSPLIPVDNLDSVYVADHIYYKKCGYYKGISVKDTPSDKMSVYEMRLFGGLIDNLLDEGVVKAIEEFKIGLCELDDELPVREMVYHTKSNNTYSAFVNGEKKKFYSVEEIVNVDFEMYQTKVLKKAETLIKPLIGLANARNILYGPNQLSLF